MIKSHVPAQPAHGALLHWLLAHSRALGVTRLCPRAAPSGPEGAHTPMLLASQNRHLRCLPLRLVAKLLLMAKAEAEGGLSAASHVLNTVGDDHLLLGFQSCCPWASICAARHLGLRDLFQTPHACHPASLSCHMSGNWGAVWCLGQSWPKVMYLCPVYPPR